MLEPAAPGDLLNRRAALYRLGTSLFIDPTHEVVQGAAHAVFIDQPERFDGLLRDFLAAADKTPG